VARLADAVRRRLVGPSPVDPGSVSPVSASGDEEGRYFLERALEEAGVGSRNERGLWLACQLRDAGLSRDQARLVMLQVAQRVPVGDHPYTASAALATLDSAFSRPPREATRRESTGSSGEEDGGPVRIGPSAPLEAAKEFIRFEFFHSGR